MKKLLLFLLLFSVLPAALIFGKQGGKGASNFVALEDTPASYSGYSNYLVKVNDAGTGLEFTTNGSGTLDHSTLANLAFSASGHTGFCSLDSEQTLAGQKTFSNNTIFNDQVGVGTSPAYDLHVAGDAYFGTLTADEALYHYSRHTDYSGGHNQNYFQYTALTGRTAHSSASSNVFTGKLVMMPLSPYSVSGWNIGMNFDVQHSADGRVNTAAAERLSVSNNGGGTILNGYGTYVLDIEADNGYGVYVPDLSASNAFGVYSQEKAFFESNGSNPTLLVNQQGAGSLIRAMDDSDTVWDLTDNGNVDADVLNGGADRIVRNSGSYVYRTLPVTGSNRFRVDVHDGSSWQEVLTAFTTSIQMRSVLGISTDNRFAVGYSLNYDLDEPVIMFFDKDHPSHAGETQIGFGSDSAASDLDTTFQVKYIHSNGTNDVTLEIDKNGNQTVQGNIMPAEDARYSLGDNSTRWHTVRAQYVISGDLAFEDKWDATDCSPFETGDSIIYKVYKTENGITYSLPIHLENAGRAFDSRCLSELMAERDTIRTIKKIEPVELESIQNPEGYEPGKTVPAPEVEEWESTYSYSDELPVRTIVEPTPEPTSEPVLKNWNEAHPEEEIDYAPEEPPEERPTPTPEPIGEVIK